MYAAEIVALVVGTVAVLLIPALVLAGIDATKRHERRAAGRQ